MSRRLVAFTALLLLGGPGSACSSEALTQIVVVVDSDWNGFDHLEIEVDGFEHPATVKANLVKQALPRRVVLVHDGGPLGPLAVTVRGFAVHRSDPVLVEPRTGIFFVSGETRMLSIHLLFDCTGPLCPAGEACVAGPSCVSSASAAKLVPWTGDVHALATDHHVDAGDVLGTDIVDGAVVVLPSMDGGSLSDAAPTSVDAGEAGARADSSIQALDAGSMPQRPAFAYTPANFDPTATDLSAQDQLDVMLDCGKSQLDSSTLRFTNWCGKQPAVITVDQLDGTDAAVLVMSSLEIAAGATLQLTGTRPVIFAVFGDARLDGTLDASAHGAAAGPGADRDCGASAGSSGPIGTGGASAGGGSAGGFGGVGGAGGANASGMDVSGGAVGGTAALTPLRGGCSGGRGGVIGSGAAAVAGAGGGAVQISTLGMLRITGRVLAGGGGGNVGGAQELGGGGGGSGGAILLEAATLSIDANAVIAANGGGGGGGQLRGLGLANAKAGEDGQAGSGLAAGGVASGSGGSGGAGAASTTEALPGAAGSTLGGGSGGGGGGGGGGSGRIRVNQAPSCVLTGMLSPPPSVSCTGCGTTCSPPSVLGCRALDRAGHTYYRCDAALPWQGARARCQAAGADLVEIDDSAENDWVRSQLSQETWIGATDMAQEGTWLWARDGSQFWSGGGNGTAVGGAFVSWSTNEPNDYGASFSPNADCATTQMDGLWRDQLCDATYPYLCE